MSSFSFHLFSLNLTNFTVPGDDDVFICILTTSFVHFQRNLVVWKVILDVGKKTVKMLVDSKVDEQKMSQQEAQDSLTVRHMCIVRHIYFFLKLLFIQIQCYIFRYAIYQDLAAKFHFQGRKRFSCCTYWFIERFFGRSVTGFDEAIISDD